MFDGSGAFHDDRVDALVYAITEVINRAGTVMDGNVTSAIGDNW